MADVPSMLHGLPFVHDPEQCQAPLRYICAKAACLTQRGLFV